MRSIATAGAIYLFYKGYQAISAELKRKNEKQILNTASGGTVSHTTAWKAIANGFLTNALNPKAFAYFVSFFAVAMANIKVAQLRTAAGVEVSILTWAWFTVAAQIVSSKYFLNIMKQYEFIINIAIGIAFMAFSIGMILFAYAPAPSILEV
ncbi:MAG: hypothetical protein K0R12_1027 [Gammaproteobacteria bacterium]|jgi:threonine/homoserine/homoserine lactone efflux protein|nr:hypothetical protein [Gammaproteobacteria bacterium]